MKKIVLISLILLIIIAIFISISSVKIPSPKMINQYNIPIDNFI